MGLFPLRTSPHTPASISSSREDFASPVRGTEEFRNASDLILSFQVPQHDYVSTAFGNNPKEYEGIFQRQGVQKPKLQQQDSVISNNSDGAKKTCGVDLSVLFFGRNKAVDKQTFSRWKRIHSNKRKVIFQDWGLGVGLSSLRKFRHYFGEKSSFYVFNSLFMQGHPI